MANWYCSSVGWTSVALWATAHAYSIGDLVRQKTTPAVGSERVFRCTTGGTSNAVTEPTWVLTKGNTTTEASGVVWTEATGVETWQGTSWAAPHARLENALAWMAVGDTVYVGSDHTQTTASTFAIQTNGTIASPQQIICVAHPSSAIPPVAADLATTAHIITTGASNIGIDDYSYWYGINFSSGSGSSNCTTQFGRSTEYQTFDNCTFAQATTFAVNFPIIFCDVILRNCSFSMNNASNGFFFTSNAHVFRMLGGSITGTAPTTLILPSNATYPPDIEFRDVDLSTVAGTLMLGANFNSATPHMKISFINCKLNASLSVAMTGTVSDKISSRLDLIVSDSTANVKVREEHYTAQGSMVSDTTNTRTGGASDGATTKSWKVVSNSAATAFRPFVLPPIYQWIFTTGSHTFSLYLANTTGALKDNEFGFELDYMGSSASPLGSFATTFQNQGVAGANIATDTSTWAGLSSPTKQVCTKTVTVNAKGLVRITPYIRKASFTVWVDPNVVVT